MKRILCFGDSNTYGYDAFTCGRFGSDVRWTGLLQSALRGSAEIIEGGLNSRTTAMDDPYRPDNKNGLSVLPGLLEESAPLDGVVVMLGTNDCKRYFQPSAAKSAGNMAKIIDVIQAFAARQGQEIPVLLVAPVPLNRDCSYYSDFNARSAEVSQELSGAYEALARQRGIAFADAGSWGIQPDFDGTHLTPEGHRKFARHILPMVRWCFGL